METGKEKVAENHCGNYSEDDEDSDGYTPEWQGTLNKWTNYIHGWQTRYIVLKNGTLSYYKSKREANVGCRGSISLFKATIKPHEFDECRFDVSVSDSVWYLRAATPEAKQQWVEILEAFKKRSQQFNTPKRSFPVPHPYHCPTQMTFSQTLAESGYGSESSLKRHGSAISLASNTLSTASTNSFKKGRGLKEKLAELETFRDILCGQIDTLQGFFDECAQNTASANVLPGSLDGSVQVRSIDFKGEAMTFKATTAGVLSTLQHCLDMVRQREDVWRKRMDREMEKRRRLEELFRALRHQSGRTAVHAGPDCEEGPHSTLNEDEFYDAVETGLDKMEEEVEFRYRLKQQQGAFTMMSPDSKRSEKDHPLWESINLVTAEQMRYAKMGVEDSDGVWQLFAEEGEMKMYRREEEVDGMVIDPLKACHVVKGVTGHEVCEYFFNPKYRLEWETTLESTVVIEEISSTTLLFHQVHKRIWPASQRDAIFWSHMRNVPDDNDHDAPDIWVVCNNSIDGDHFPANSTKCVRLYLKVCLMCQTIVDPPKDGAELSRNDLTCKITYCSVVNPGGWAPASVLRAVYKREYPKFLKRFTNYVIEQRREKPILF